ncbi:MAG: dynamin family protein [Rhodobacteraceae bacterium]|nr:dynamin family protein [Paracoccaceae bacterium]
MLPEPAPQSDRPAILDCFAPLSSIRAECAAMLSEVATHGSKAMRAELDACITRTGTASPVITIVGQVKAGKTALANALAYAPDLLPRDVNPSPTVVTSLHLNAPDIAPGHAEFTFLGREDWGRLRDGGGRMGEIARRANHEAEIALLKDQVDDMQRKARQRLGANFDMLLGSKHRFSAFDPALVAKYVCHGDEDDGAPVQGRYADVTKSAALHLDAPEYGIPLTLRDTPGVNDPLLVREETTLQSLRDTDICLVVLSAHQAMTTSDLALIRILNAMNAEQIVLFINRIDELDDPEAQCPEIEAHVKATLAQHGCGQDAPIVFGSALWANAALTGAQVQLPSGNKGSAGPSAGTDLWTASGLARLQDVLAANIGTGAFALGIDRATNEAGNTVRQLGLRVAAAQTERAEPALDAGELNRLLCDMRNRFTHRLEQQIERIVPAMRRDLQDAADAFSQNECDALKAALAAGKDATWSADGNALRTRFKAIYLDHAAECRNMAQDTLAALAAELSKTYCAILGRRRDDLSLSPAQPPEPAPPVALGATLAFDLGKGWWTGWLGGSWRRQARLKDLRRIIAEETRPLIHALEHENLLEYFARTRAVLMEDLDRQSAILTELVAEDGSEKRHLLREELGLHAEHQAQVAALEALETRIEEVRAARRELA